MFRRVVVAGALALLLLACTEDKPSSSAVGTASSISSSATDSTTTTTTVPQTVPKSPASSPQEAATSFVNAWRDGNQLAALTIADQGAVDAVFPAGAPGRPESRGCNSPPVPDAPVRCVYRTAVGELTVQASPRDGGWIIDSARLSQG